MLVEIPVVVLAEIDTRCITTSHLSQLLELAAFGSGVFLVGLLLELLDFLIVDLCCKA
jgi:hypothetical protein